MNIKTNISYKNTLLLHDFTKVIAHHPPSDNAKPVFTQIKTFLSNELGVINLALVCRDGDTEIVEVLGQLDDKLLNIAKHCINSEKNKDSIISAHIHCRHFNAGSKEYYFVLFGPDMNQRSGAELNSFINLAISSIAPLLLLQEAKDYIYKNLLDQNQKIAHDLKKPIAMVKKLIKNFSSKKSSQDHNSLTDLNKSLDYADDLLEDIISPNQNNFKKIDFNLKDVIEESLLEAQSSHDESKDISYQVDTDDYLPFSGNRQSIQRTLINLLDNAIDATGNPGTIYVSATKKAEDIAISIANTGSYIEEINRELIFEPRFSLGKKNGNGLGLAIVKQVVEEHGGKVSCSSSPQNITTFDISLPANEIRGALPRLKRSDHSAESQTVIVIDDDPFTLEFWRSQNYPMLQTFSKPREFFEHFSSKEQLNTNTVVITDYYFDNEPRMTGYDFARKIKEQIEIPVVLSSDVNLINPEVSKAFDRKISKNCEDPLKEALALLE